MREKEVEREREREIDLFLTLHLTKLRLYFKHYCKHAFTKHQLL